MGLAEAVDCPLHLGITEAGGLIGGTVKSAIGIGNLLWAGIGDTIRVSLSAEPEEEVRVGFEILKALGRSEEHTSELQSLMRISYAVFCLKKKKIIKNHI